MAPTAGSATIDVTMDTQRLYDQARAASAAYLTMAEGLVEAGGVCTHDPDDGADHPAVPDGNRLCLACGREVSVKVFGTAPGDR